MYGWLHRHRKWQPDPPLIPSLASAALLKHQLPMSGNRLRIRRSVSRLHVRLEQRIL
jgi:hypothetical protein